MSERLAAAGAAALIAIAFAGCSRNASDPEERRGAGDEPETGAEVAEPESERQAQVPEGPVGTIEGRVELEGEAPERVPLRRGSDPGCDQGEMLSETVITGTGGGLQNAFVRLRGDDLAGPKPRDPVVIDQSDCMYRPRVQGAVVGQTLRVVNSDATLHNVHAREMTLERGSARTVYNLAQPAGSGDIERPITAADVMELRCDLHAWMRAFVVVSDHPYFATTGDDGAFTIENVPVGTHELELWHELYGSKTVQITVDEGETATVELAFDAEADRPN